MLFAFSIAPSTTPEPDGSMSHIVARAVEVIRDSGLPQETSSMFTTTSSRNLRHCPAQPSGRSRDNPPMRV